MTVLWKIGLLLPLYAPTSSGQNKMACLKAETMESQDQLPQSEQQGKGTTFLKTCFNGINALAGLSIWLCWCALLMRDLFECFRISISKLSKLPETAFRISLYLQHVNHHLLSALSGKISSFSSLVHEFMFIFCKTTLIL